MRKLKSAGLILLCALMFSAALATTRTVPQATGEETVYVTKTGTKYHQEDCSTLKKTKIPMKLKDAVKAGYEPCKVCHPPTISKKNQ